MRVGKERKRRGQVLTKRGKWKKERKEKEREEGRVGLESVKGTRWGRVWGKPKKKNIFYKGANERLKEEEEEGFQGM